VLLAGLFPAIGSDKFLRISAVFTEPDGAFNPEGNTFVALVVEPSGRVTKNLSYHVAFKSKIS
jgi:hypothetical protein